jgi:hypothetical protein
MVGPSGPFSRFFDLGYLSSFGPSSVSPLRTNPIVVPEFPFCSYSSAKLSGFYRAAPEPYPGAPQAEAGPAAAVPESTPDPRKASKFRADRLRPIEMLKLLTHLRAAVPLVLSYGRTGHSEHEHNPIGKGERLDFEWTPPPSECSAQSQPPPYPTETVI